MNNRGFGHRKQAISIDCRDICPLAQYGLQCGHKLSDDGLNAMTAPKDRGPRNREGETAKGGTITIYLIDFRPVAYYARMCSFGHHLESCSPCPGSCLVP